ncbi:hypothetical protein HN935_03155 [archaeon]|jgi:hypothetical protein|nr:hypothetical protein [archaeon]
MKVKDLLNELTETEHYKNFKSQNPESFFAAAFFILDVETKTEKIQLDFFLPNQNKIASFEHPWNEAQIHDDEIKPMQPQSTEIKIDIDDLESICKKTIKENESAIVPTKIIAILRDNQWNLTCMDNALGIVRIKIDATSSEQADFSKGSLMDFMGIKKN